MMWAPILAGALACAVPAAVQDPGSQPHKRALLVGVQDYEHPPDKEFGQLEGPRNDVDLVRLTLIERFGFAGDDVLVLKDEQATHENIVRKFVEHLIDPADEDTEALFWFSGHGSRVPDRSGRAGAEQNGMDSTFLAYDSRARERDGSYDIVDDEFHALLSALAKKTGRITVVTDACYSGGGFRGGRGAARGVERGSQPFDSSAIESFWPADIPILDDGDPKRADLAGRYIHISACSNDRRAWEVHIQQDGERRTHGGLTWFLVQEMREAKPGETYRQIGRRTSLSLSTCIPEQSAWYEGALDRELFGAAFVARRPGFPAHVGEGGKIEIEAGALHGLRYDTGVIVREGEREIGRATVRRVRAWVAVARWNGKAPEIEAPDELTVVEASRPAELPPLKLWVADEELRAGLASNPFVDPDCASPRLADCELTARDASGLAALRTEDGIEIWRARLPADPQRAVEMLGVALRAELQFRALWNLGLEEGLIDLSAEFVPPTPGELERGIPGVRAVDAKVAPLGGEASNAEFRASLPPFDDGDDEGCLAILEITNHHGSPAHVAVLSVGENREINLVWPAQGERDNVLASDAKRRVPIWVGADPDWPLERPMRDRYLLIATADYVDFSAFVRGRAPGADQPLPGMLRATMTGEGARGERRITVDRRNWGTAVVDMLVERR